MGLFDSFAAMPTMGGIDEMIEKMNNIEEMINQIDIRPEGVEGYYGVSCNMTCISDENGYEMGVHIVDSEGKDEAYESTGDTFMEAAVNLVAESQKPQELEEPEDTDEIINSLKADNALLTERLAYLEQQNAGLRGDIADLENQIDKMFEEQPDEAECDCDCKDEPADFFDYLDWLINRKK